jgi:ribonuclease R
MHIPMLPRCLATDRCSLKPDESRLCESVMFLMDENCNVVSLRHVLATNFQEKYFIMKSRIKSKYRFSYEEVEYYLNGIRSFEISAELKSLNELSQKLEKKRFEDGQFYI